MSITPTLRPKSPTFAAWRLMFDSTLRAGASAQVRKLFEQPFIVYCLNSLFITLMTLALSLPITSFAAYANSKLQRGPSTRWVFLFCIGTLMVPAAVTLIPSFLLTRNFPFAMPNPPAIPGTTTPFPVLRIWDTPWAVIVPGLFSAFNFLLFKGFFDIIPDSVIQAARVDGDSEFNIYRRIVLPMSVPVYAVAAWIQFGGVWDSFLWPLLVIQDNKKQMASVMVYNLMTSFIRSGSTSADQAVGQSQAMSEILEKGLSWNGLMVLGLLQTIPIFVMFIICREYLLRGIRIRGLK
jgi:ABC-type glycerol-3-phosphate transport system permease component